MHALIYKNSKKCIWGWKISSTIYMKWGTCRESLSQDTHKLSNQLSLERYTLKSNKRLHIKYWFNIKILYKKKNKSLWFCLNYLFRAIKKTQMSLDIFAEYLHITIRVPGTLTLSSTIFITTVSSWTVFFLYSTRKQMFIHNIWWPWRVYLKITWKNILK